MNFNGAKSEHKENFHCYGCGNGEFLDKIMEAPLFEPFFTRGLKILSRTDSFMLCGKLGVHFFSNSEMLQQKMKVDLRLLNVRPNFDLISNISNVSLGIVDCWLLTRRVALKREYHEKRRVMLAYIYVVVNYLESLAKTSIIPARRNQFIQQNIFNNAPVSRNAIAMNTNSAFNGSYTENPFWNRQFDLKQIILLREVNQSKSLMPLKIDVDMLRQWKQWTFKMTPFNSNW